MFSHVLNFSITKFNYFNNFRCFVHFLCVFNVCVLIVSILVFMASVVYFVLELLSPILCVVVLFFGCRSDFSPPPTCRSGILEQADL